MQRQNRRQRKYQNRRVENKFNHADAQRIDIEVQTSAGFSPDPEGIERNAHDEVSYLRADQPERSYYHHS